VNLKSLLRCPGALSAAAALVAATAALALWLIALGPAPLGDGLAFSTTVVDRDGRLLRPYATNEGRWRLPVQAGAVDPRFLALLIACEDRRFRDHTGVDPLALARAAGQMASHRRIVSGASTLTMQVARLLEPRTERSLGAKLRQAVRAVEIERRLTKDEILSLYLNLAPYGGNLEGIRAASLAYFGKEPRRLTIAESALLVALPQAPEARRPDRSAAVARRARDRVLDRALAAGVFDAAEIARAKLEPVSAARAPMPPSRRRRVRKRARKRPRKPPRKPRRHRCCSSPSMHGGRRALRNWRASGRGRWGRTFPLQSSPSITPPARCWRGSARPTTSTPGAPGRST
jgi:penicillin-binding protein 1C